jgi:hypothetical protein
MFKAGSFPAVEKREFFFGVMLQVGESIFLLILFEFIHHYIYNKIGNANKQPSFISLPS